MRIDYKKCIMVTIILIFSRMGKLVATSLRPITKINLKLLQSFVFVAEQYSFRQAAALIGHSQSAVSAQIKRLEAQLGVALFHRTTRRVQLTAEGEQLLSCARGAIAEVELGLRRIQEAVDVKHGRISFSCSPTIALERLAPILAEFERDYPDIEVFVRENSAAALLECIRQRQVDFGFGPLLEAPDLQFDPILEDPLYAVMHKDFGSPYDTTITLRELARLPLLLLDRTTALRTLVEESAAQLGLTLNTRYQFTQAQTLISMASSALGVAILPKIALPDGLDRPLRMVRIVEPPLARQLAIITLRGHTLSPAASKLVPLFRELAGAGKSRARKSGAR